MARAFVGKDPFEKYAKRNGVFFVFGIDAKHLGSVIYKKLFRAGAFKMIRDPKTFLWRAFNPVADAALIKEAKPAPPLIPPRYIDWVVWDQKRAGIPSCVVLKNGTEIHFYSINAEMPRGVDIDGAWIDEEAVKSGIVAEILARLVDRGGRLVWSATPQSGGDQLFDLMESAGSVDVDLFHAHIWDNVHIAEEEKDAFFRRLSEDERRVRWYGEPMLSGFTVYPEFSRVVHSFPEGRGWQPPDDWARYISVDPGRQVCYVSFLTVPPPWVGQFVVIHDELHLEKCDAEMYGKELGMKSQHGVTYEAALIDGNQCRVSDMGSGKSIEDQYRNAMFKFGVRVRTGGFTWGADDVAPGIEAVHSWLRVGTNGTPYMRVLVENCPWLCREMLKYRYVKDQHGMPSNKVLKKNDHACFVAGTMIATPTGDVPIDKLRIGDEILTHLGVGVVLGNAITNSNADVVVVVDENDERAVICTPDHPFALASGGWTVAGCSVGMSVLRLKKRVVDHQKLKKTIGKRTPEERRELSPRNVRPCRIGIVGNTSRKYKVYALATSDGTYFANGFLVSNCDTVRYFAMLNPRWVRPLARIKKDKFSSYEHFLARKKSKEARHGGGGSGGVIRFGMGTQ